MATWGLDKVRFWKPLQRLHTLCLQEKHAAGFPMFSLHVGSLDHSGSLISNDSNALWHQSQGCSDIAKKTWCPDIQKVSNIYIKTKQKLFFQQKIGSAKTSSSPPKVVALCSRTNLNQVTSSHCQPKQLVRQVLSQIMVKSVKSVKKNYASTTLYSAICAKVAGKVILQKPCLNLSSAFHVHEPSWPTNMKLWRVKPSKSPAVPVPHWFLSSFLT